MLNPTANNYLLPLKGELTNYIVDSDATLHEMRVREQGMQIQIGWTQAQTFNELNRTWWETYFNKMKFSELKVMAELLEVDPYMRSKKVYYVLALSDHYRSRFQ